MPNKKSQGEKKEKNLFCFVLSHVNMVKWDIANLSFFLQIVINLNQ